ncbi:hypothetical protein OBV_44460 [Oscillibacter valericigenes Sjm18-20]|nr:hypothetical protein OBV_44460 [Oscillibacter valericigenes Sjm18-20]
MDSYAYRYEPTERVKHEITYKSVLTDICVHRYALFLLQKFAHQCRSPPLVLRFQSHFENLEDKHMSENKKYTIVVKQQRVAVSEAVYRAYHKEREAERYQNKLIRQNELSLERFGEDGVNIDYLIVRVQPDILDKLIHQEQLEALCIALQSLPEDERSIIDELFFNDKKEADLAAELLVTQQAISKRKKKILDKLKKMIEF